MANIIILLVDRLYFVFENHSTSLKIRTNMLLFSMLLIAKAHSICILLVMHIKKANYLISSPDYTKCPVADRPEYAFIGRSNVGKSSLINMLCNNDKLAKTSNSPGKTQMINHFEITGTPKTEEFDEENWYLVDLPGYGFAKISLRSRRRWEQMIENYLRRRENLLQVFVL